MILGTTNNVQLYELFLCGGMGFLLGGCYDVFRLLRACVRNVVFTFAADIVFCLLSGVIGFLFCLAVTDGIVRLYVLVGFFIGFLAYRRTVYSVTRRISGRIFCKKAEKPQKNTCSVRKYIV